MPRVDDRFRRKRQESIEASREGLCIAPRKIGAPYATGEEGITRDKAG